MVAVVFVKYSAKISSDSVIALLNFGLNRSTVKIAGPKTA